MESLNAALLSFFLSQYIEEVDRKQVKTKLLSGKIKLSDLAIKSTALSSHGLPVKVVQGIVSKINLKCPFTKLKEKATKARVSGIYVLGSLAGDLWTDNDLASHISQFSEIDKLCSRNKTTKKNIFMNSAYAIVNHLEVNVEKIHIRLEVRHGENVSSVGVVINRIESYTVNQETKEKEFITEERDVICKLVRLDGVSIYVDAESMEVNREKFVEDMEISRTSPHNFILKDFAMDATVLIPMKDISHRFDVSVGISALNMLFDKDQWNSISLFIDAGNKCLLQRFYSSCGRPVEYKDEEVEAWWMFANRAARRKRYPMEFHVDRALVFLRNRGKELKRFTDILKNKDTKLQLKLEAKYGGDVCQMFLCYAVTVKQIELNRQLEQSSDLDIETANLKIRDFNDSISVIHFNAQVLKMILKHADSNLATFMLSMVTGNVEISATGMKLSADIDDALVADNVHQRDIFTLRKDEGHGSCVHLAFVLDTLKRSFGVDASASAPNIHLSFDSIAQMISFFKGGVDMINLPTETGRETPQLEVLWLLDNHYTMNLSFVLGAPEIVIPTQSPIKIVLGEMTLKTTDQSLERVIENPESLYDHFHVDVKGFQITVEERTICEPADTFIDLALCFVKKHDLPAVKVDVLLSDIVFKMNRHGYETLLSIVSLVKSLDLARFKKTVAYSEDTKTKIEKLASFSVSLIQKKFVFVWTDEFHSSIQLDGMNISVCGLGCEYKADMAFGSLVALYDDQQMLKFSNEAGQSLTFHADSHKDLAGLTNLEMELGVSTIDVMLDVPKLFTLIKSFIPPQAFLDENTGGVVTVATEQKAHHMNAWMIERRLQKHPNIRMKGRMDRLNVQIVGEKVLQLGLSGISIGTNEHFHTRNTANQDDFYDSVNAAIQELSMSVGEKYVIAPINASLVFKLRFIPVEDLELIRLALNIDDVNIDLDDAEYKFAVKCAYEIGKQVSGLNLISTGTGNTEIGNNAMSMLMDLSLTQLSAKVKDNGTTLADIVNGKTTVSIKLKENEMYLKVELDNLIGTENGKRMVQLDDGLTLLFDKKTSNDDEQVQLKFNIKDPLLSFNDSWLKSIVAFFLVPDLKSAHKMLEHLDVGATRDVVTESGKQLQFVIAGTIVNFRFLVCVEEEQYVFSIPSLTLEQADNDNELTFNIEGLGMSCNARNIIAPITAKGALVYSYDTSSRKYHFGVRAPIEVVSLALAKCDYERFISLIEIFKPDEQQSSGSQVTTTRKSLSLDMDVALDVKLISLSLQSEQELSLKIAEMAFHMKDESMTLQLSSVSVSYGDMTMIDYQNGIHVEVGNLSSPCKRVSCHIDGPSLTLSTVLFGKIDTEYRYLVKRLNWILGPLVASSERPVRAVIDPDISVSNLSCKFQAEEYGIWTVKEFVIQGCKDEDATMSIEVKDAALGGILSVDNVSLTYGQKSNHLKLRSTPITGKFAVRWLRDLYTIIEPFLAKTGGPPPMPRIVYDIEVPKVSLVVIGKGRNVLDVQAQDLKMKTPDGNRELSHFSGKNIVSEGYVHVDKVSGSIAWTFADELAEKWSHLRGSIRPLCVDDRYLVAIAVDIDIGNGHIDYDQLKTQVLCESCSEMIPDIIDGQDRIIDVSVNLIAHDISLMLNDIFKRPVSDARFENLEVIMRSPEDIIVKCDWFSINDGAISPVSKGNALTVKYTKDAVDIALENFKADLDVIVLCKMITILIQCPFVTFRWPNVKDNTNIEVMLCISTCLIGIPISTLSNSEYLYLTIGFDFSLRGKDIFVNLRQICACFAQGRDQPLYAPILRHFGCSVGVSEMDQRRTITVRSDPLSLDVTAADIASLLVMGEYCFAGRWNCKKRQNIVSFLWCCRWSLVGYLLLFPKVTEMLEQLSCFA